MQSHKTGKAPLVSLPGKTYELSFLIRNTDWCGQALKAWVTVLMHRSHRPARPAGSEQEEQGQTAQKD